MRRRAALLVFTAALVGCSGHRIAITSLPAGATVYEQSPKGEKIRLGKTPVTIDDKTDLDRRNLLLELPGYLPKQLMVVYPYQSKSKILVYLTRLDDGFYRKVLEVEHPDKIDQTVAELIALEDYLVNSDEDPAEEIKRREGQLGKFSTFHSLVGMHYFRKKDMGRAREAFEKAIRLNKDNETARSMLGVIGK